MRALVSATVHKPFSSQSDTPACLCFCVQTVDPRQVAQRIMDIRISISKEFQEDLNSIQDENMELLKKTLMASLKFSDPTGHEPTNDCDDTKLNCNLRHL